MKIGDYEIVVKKGDQELEKMPDDLPVIDFEGNQVTLAEARDGYMRTSDYTKKTQSVADMKKFLKDELGFEDSTQGVATMRRVLDKMAELESMGILDTRTGEIKIPKAGKDNPPKGDDDEETFAIGMDMLPPELQALVADHHDLQKDMGKLMSYITRKEIRDSFKDMEEEEISIALKMAAIDPSKSPMEHAVALAEKRKEWGQKAVDAFVEEQKQPVKDGHVRKTSGELAAEIFGEDPVFTYRPQEHEGKKALSPSEAANAYMEGAMKEIRGED